MLYRLNNPQNTFGDYDELLISFGQPQRSLFNFQCAILLCKDIDIQREKASCNHLIVSLSSPAFLFLCQQLTGWLVSSNQQSQVLKPQSLLMVWGTFSLGMLYWSFKVSSDWGGIRESLGTLQFLFLPMFCILPLPPCV